MRMNDFILDDTNAPSDMSMSGGDSHSSDDIHTQQKFNEKLILEAQEKNKKLTLTIDKELIKFKAFFLLFFAGFGSTFPYLGVYFKQIGLNASYVGILAGVRPLIQFISGPFWALLADKYKARKSILLFSILAWLVMTLLLAFPRPHNEVCRATNVSHIAPNITQRSSHRSLISGLFQGRHFGEQIYTSNCLNCHKIKKISKRNVKDDYNTRYERSERLNNSNVILDIKVEYKNNNKYNNNNFNNKHINSSMYNKNNIVNIKHIRNIKHNKNKNRNNIQNNNNNKRSNIINSDTNYTATWDIQHKITPEKTEHRVYHMKYTIERDQNEIQEIFYVFLVLIVIGEFLEAPSFIMIDTALLDHLGTEKKHYGKTRLFGSIGYGVASFSVGALLDRFQYDFCGKQYTNYMIIFYLFTGFMVIGFLFGLFFVNFKYHATKEKSKPLECLKLFLSVKYGSFLTICWFCGFCHGSIMNFLNWYLEDLGASKLMMGVATACRCTAIISGFFMSSIFIDRFGHIHLICWALFSYVISYFAYAAISNPWYAIPVEVIQGLIYAISWSSCITYLGEAAPPNTGATMQGILQGVYWGLGTGTGAIVGGILINHYGVRCSFRVGGVVSSIIFVLFCILQFVIARKEKSIDSKK